MKLRTISMAIVPICASALLYSFIVAQIASAKPAAPAPTTLTFRHVSYTVRDEDDGAGGDGVDLYMGWLVVGKDKSFGGTSTVVGGLKNNNGAGPHKHEHVRNEKMFSIDVPTDTVIYVKFNMIESDQTTDKIKKAYSEARLPVFGDGAFKGNVTVSAGNLPKAIADGVASVVGCETLMGARVTGSASSSSFRTSGRN